MAPRIEAHAKERPCIWGGSAGKAAPSAAAHSAFEAEAANAGGQAFAEGLIDLKQAYERVDHASLAASLLFSPPCTPPWQTCCYSSTKPRGHSRWVERLATGQSHCPE